MSTKPSPHIVCSVEVRKGRPTLLLDGVPEAPFFYALPDVPGGRWSWEEHAQHNIDAFARAGFRLFQVDVFLEHLVFPDGSVDVSLLTRQIRGVLDRVPDAGIMVRLHVNAPGWWTEAHPEELTVYDDVPCVEECAVGLTRILEADPRNACRPSLASERWRSFVDEKLEQVIGACAATVEGRSLVAVQIACGVYGEWHYWGFMRWEPDLSPCMTRRFRRWLRDRYPDDAGLAAAWHDDDARIDTATVPDTKERSRTSGVFRDPMLHRRTIDYYRCQHELIPELIVGFSRTVKAAWPVPIATGAFYGYYFSLFNRQAAGGHLEIDRLLAAPEVDFLCGPQVYYPDDQEPGMPYRSRALLASVRHHGKLWLDEYDQEPGRTFPYLGGMTDNREAYEINVRRNRACIRRNTVFAFHHGMGLWFYDFGPSGMHINRRGEYNGQLGTAGYWDNPAYMKDVGRIKREADRRIELEYTSSADVLLVFDPRAHYYLKSTVDDPDPITPRSIDWMTLGLYYAGVVFDSATLADALAIDSSPYRLIIMANTYVLDDETVTAVWDKARDVGAELLWIHAPGILEGVRLRPERVSEVLGLDLERHECSTTLAFRLSGDHGAVRTEVEMIDGPCDPHFSVSDERAEVYGRYTDDDRACLVRYEREGVTAWYAGLPPQRPATLEPIRRSAGVHRYTQDGDIVYAGGGLLTVHTGLGGVRPVTLRSGRRLGIDFGPGAGTCILDEESGEQIASPEIDTALRS